MVLLQHALYRDFVRQSLVLDLILLVLLLTARKALLQSVERCLRHELRLYLAQEVVEIIVLEQVGSVFAIIAVIWRLWQFSRYAVQLVEDADGVVDDDFLVIVFNPADGAVDLDAEVRRLYLRHGAARDGSADRAVASASGGRRYACTSRASEAVEKAEVAASLLPQLRYLRLRLRQLVLQRLHLNLQLRLLVKHQINARLQLVHLDVV